YLSDYLKQHQAEYYRQLSNIRSEGNWESWVAFFLEGVAIAASGAERSIISIASLMSTDRHRLLASSKVGPASYRLFEMLPMMPRFTYVYYVIMYGAHVELAVSPVNAGHLVGAVS
ncbi:MAG: hypothetical protein ACYCUY_04990, partial [Acidithiobacillus sp.]